MLLVVSITVEHQKGQNPPAQSRFASLRQEADHRTKTFFSKNVLAQQIFRCAEYLKHEAQAVRLGFMRPSSFTSQDITLVRLDAACAALGFLTIPESLIEFLAPAKIKEPICKHGVRWGRGRGERESKRGKP